MTYGLRYLRRLLDGVDGRAVLALAGYNAGMSRVRRWRRRARSIRKIRRDRSRSTETRDYVKNILVAHRAYHRVYAPDGVCRLEH